MKDDTGWAWKDEQLSTTSPANNDILHVNFINISGKKLIEKLMKIEKINRFLTKNLD